MKSLSLSLFVVVVVVVVVCCCCCCVVFLVVTCFVCFYGSGSGLEGYEVAAGERRYGERQASPLGTSEHKMKSLSSLFVVVFVVVCCCCCS